MNLPRSGAPAERVGVRIRPWTDADAPSLPGLLDRDADPLWVEQSHRLHGHDRDGERWRRTLVAVEGAPGPRRVVGAVTAARNPVHPGQLSCAVEVTPSRRRSGVGRALLAAIRAVRREPLPLVSKMRPGDRAALGFLEHAGGWVRQVAPGQVLDLGDPALRAWAVGAGRTSGAGDHETPAVRMGPLAVLDRRDVADAFADQYAWVHASWSPVPPGPAAAALAAVARSTADEVDLEVSSGGWSSGRLVAMALAFPAGDQPPGSTAGGQDPCGARWEVVAETVPSPGAVEAEGVDGVGILRAALARTVLAAAEHGPGALEMDGHADDPHLVPALSGIPASVSRPLLLVQAP